MLPLPPLIRWAQVPICWEVTELMYIKVLCILESALLTKKETVMNSLKIVGNRYETSGQ